VEVQHPEINQIKITQVKTDQVNTEQVKIEQVKLEHVEIEQVDTNSSLPLYLQAELILRKMIRRSEYADGDRLIPHELDLAIELGVSRSTIRQALNKLVFEGLLLRKKGMGTRVCEAPLKICASDWYQQDTELALGSASIRVLEVEVTMERAPRPIARFFSLSEKRSILRINKLLECGQGARMYSTSWLKPDATLHMQLDFEKEPVYKVLSTLGYRLKRAKEELSAHTPEPWVYKKLAIKPGSVVMYRRRCVYDHYDKLLEYRLELYDASKFIMDYSLRVPEKDY